MDDRENIKVKKRITVTDVLIFLLVVDGILLIYRIIEEFM